MVGSARYAVGSRGGRGMLVEKYQIIPLVLHSTERRAMDACDTCAFVYADVDARALPERLTAFGPRYRAQLLPAGRATEWQVILRTRPATDVWSALEYACHLRDVFLMLRERLYTMLV